MISRDTFGEEKHRVQREKAEGKGGNRTQKSIFEILFLGLLFNIFIDI